MVAAFSMFLDFNKAVCWGNSKDINQALSGAEQERQSSVAPRYLYKMASFDFYRVSSSIVDNLNLDIIFFTH
jgi:hypothetical protein